MAARKSTTQGSAPRKKSRALPQTSSAAKKTAAKKTAAKKTAAKKTAAKKTASTQAPPRIRKRTRAEALAIYEELKRLHPDAHCELEHENTFQLLVATVLSAQATDVAVNKATPQLFSHYPTPERLAVAEQADVEQKIGSLGMFRQKAKNIIGLAQGLVKLHQGEVPASLEALVALPGVGRKTANVVLGVAFRSPEGVVVDTHVQRLTQRLGWTRDDNPIKIEAELMKLLPRDEWDQVSHTLIFHGRRVCDARKPACSSCAVEQLCPSAFQAELVGRKPPRPPRNK